MGVRASTVARAEASQAALGEASAWRRMQKAVQAPEAAAAGEVAGDDGNGEQRRPPPVQSLSSLPASGGGKSGPPSAGRSKSIDGSGAPGSGGASKEKLRNRLMRMSTEAMADGSWNETPGGESSGQAGPVELDCEMLRMILMDAGNPFSEEEMAAFFELADPDDAGKVSLEALGGCRAGKRRRRKRRSGRRRRGSWRSLHPRQRRVGTGTSRCRPAPISSSMRPCPMGCRQVMSSRSRRREARLRPSSRMASARATPSASK